MSVRIVHDLEGGHSYVDDANKEVVGVTTVLKPLSERFYRGVQREVMEDAAALGRAVHLMIHFDCKGTLDEESLGPDLIAYLRDWRDFRATSGFEPYLSEYVVHSPKYGYAGQIDLFGSLNGQPVHIDTKCTTKLMPTVGPQLAGYHQALSESGHAPERRFALSLRSRSDNPWRLVEYKDPNDLRVFLSCLTIHNYIKAHE